MLSSRSLLIICFIYCSVYVRRRQWQPTPVLLPGKSHGRRSLVGCSPWGREESDTTERLHFHFSLSCVREGNGNPLRCSCLENPRDGRAWWAATYGVMQSRTRLKRLSSSSVYGNPNLPIYPSLTLPTDIHVFLFVCSCFWNWLTGWFEMETGHERWNKQPIALKNIFFQSQEEW